MVLTSNLVFLGRYVKSMICICWWARSSNSSKVGEMIRIETRENYSLPLSPLELLNGYVPMLLSHYLVVASNSLGGRGRREQMVYVYIGNVALVCDRMTSSASRQDSSVCVFGGGNVWWVRLLWREMRYECLPPPPKHILAPSSNQLAKSLAS